MTGDEQSELNLRVLYERAQSETELAWTRKAAHESRAFAVFTLNLGLVTLYFATRDVLGLDVIEPSSAHFGWIFGALLVMILSTVVAVFVAIPGRYPALHIGDMREMLARYAIDAARYDEVLVYRQIENLQTIHETNRSNAQLVMVALILSGGAIVLFIIALSLEGI